MHASLEAAATRLRLAEALWQLEDSEGAELELDSAESVFARNEVWLYMEDCSRQRAVLNGASQPAA